RRGVARGETDREVASRGGRRSDGSGNGCASLRGSGRNAHAEQENGIGAEIALDKIGRHTSPPRQTDQAVRGGDGEIRDANAPVEEQFDLEVVRVRSTIFRHT